VPLSDGPLPNARSASSIQRCSRALTMSLSRRAGMVLELLKIPTMSCHKLLRRRRSRGTFGFALMARVVPCHYCKSTKIVRYITLCIPADFNIRGPKFPCVTVPVLN